MFGAPGLNVPEVRIVSFRINEPFSNIDGQYRSVFPCLFLDDPLDLLDVRCRKLLVLCSKVNERSHFLDMHRSERAPVYMPVFSFRRNLNNETFSCTSIIIGNGCLLPNAQDEFGIAAACVRGNSQLGTAYPMEIVPFQPSTTSKLESVYMNTFVKGFFAGKDFCVWYTMKFVFHAGPSLANCFLLGRCRTLIRCWCSTGKNWDTSQTRRFRQWRRLNW